MVQVNSFPTNNILNYFSYEHSGHSYTNAYILALLNYHHQAGKLDVAQGESNFHEIVNRLSTEGAYKTINLVDENIGVAVLRCVHGTICIFRGVHYDISDEWTQGPSESLNAKMYTPHTSWGQVRIHQRFYRAVTRVYRDIHQIIQLQDNYGTEPKPLFITGHGRGASFAAICAYQLKRVDNIKAQNVYLFGAPRSGDHLGFRRHYKAEGLWDSTFRWVHYSDYANQVPNFDLEPPYDLNSQYAHIGRLNLIDQRGTVHMDYGTPEFNPGITDSSFAEHRIENYVQQMWNRLPSSIYANATNTLSHSLLSTPFPLAEEASSQVEDSQPISSSTNGLNRR